MSRFPEQVRVVAEQAVLEGHADFEADFTEAVSQEPVPGESFKERVNKIGKVIHTMLKLLAWIWAVVTEDWAKSNAMATTVTNLVMRMDNLEKNGAQHKPFTRLVIRASGLKGVGSMKVFNLDRSEYKAWHAKLVNVMSQLPQRHGVGKGHA